MGKHAQLVGFGSALVALSLAMACGKNGDSEPSTAGDGDGDTAGDGDGDGDRGIGAPALPTSVSGSRIKQKWYQGGDAAVPQGLFDAELGISCSMIRATDEAWHCLPSGGNVQFLDDACTEAVLVHYTGGDCDAGDPPKYGGLYSRSTACGEVQVHTVWEGGDLVDTPATIYQERDGDCVERATEAGEVLYAASIAPPDTFVSAEEVVDERTEVLGVKFLVTSDGGWFPQSPVNLDKGNDCSVASQTAGSGTTHHCLGAAAPSNPAFSGFSDDACTANAALFFNACVDPDVVVSTSTDENGCDVTEFRDLGEELTTFYANADDTCVEDDGSSRPGNRHFAVGGPAQDLIDLEIAEPSGTTRLVDRYYAFEEAPIWRVNEAYDTDLEAFCSIVPLQSGAIACVPGPSVNIGGGSVVYKDDGCTQALSPGWGNPCTTNPPRYALYGSEDVCAPGVAAIYELGPAYSSDTVYNGEPGSCFSSNADPDLIWYERGRAVNLEKDLALFTETVDD